MSVHGFGGGLRTVARLLHLCAREATCYLLNVCVFTACDSQLMNWRRLLELGFSAPILSVDMRLLL
jgi:hypothetical protein